MNSVALASKPSTGRIFDLNGNHLQQHGSTVWCNTPRIATMPGTPVAVFSRFGMGTAKRAQVFVQADTGPFVLAMALSPVAAREHAHALLAAADRADEVQAIVKAAV